ncbi:MAG: hypothetical protein JWM21_831 [Acidobacteria bacterium]|nr:hypothetical protein [Acidobacteriota bacterium]
MKKKRKRKATRNISVRHALQSLHLGFAIAPLIASIVATLVGRDIHYKIELDFIIVVITANFSILWLRWPRLFYTFWTDDLPPSQSGHEQTYHAEVAIIEDRQSSYYRDKVQHRFKTEVDFEQLRSALSKEPKLKNTVLSDQMLKTHFFKKVKDDNLFFRQIEVGAPTEVDSEVNSEDDPAKQVHPEALQDELKRFLDGTLERAEAVVMVRTSGLDQKGWTYAAVNDWAYEHSEVPILFAQDPNKGFSDDETAKNFLWIRDDPKSLPWSLLQQAKERGKAWRDQATYNRAMVWNILYISLMCIWIGAIWLKATDETVGKQKNQFDQSINNQRVAYDQSVNKQKLEYQTAMRATDEALRTERSYRQDYASAKGDPNLSISYWFRHNEKPYVFVTTEIPHNTKFFENGYDR